MGSDRYPDFVLALVIGALAIVVEPSGAKTTSPPAASADDGAAAETAPARNVRKTRPVRHRPKTEAPDPPSDPEPPLDPKECASWERKIAINPDGGLHVGLKTYAQTLQLKDREIVLTFDDGPEKATTPAVLDALKQNCAHATFFLIGRATKAAPNLAAREMAEGHTVGHHSFSHPAFTMRGFDEASGKQDIEAGVAADEHAIYGADARPDRPHVPFFRFPGFADTPALLAYLDGKDYTVFGTDLWASDWLRMSGDEERDRVLSLLERAPHHNGIFLFHDSIASTAEMLPDLLRELRRRRYTIAHLVYDPKAPPPDLTPPVKGWSHEASQTERIIRSLKKKIVPGSHHFGEPAKAAEPADDPQTGPR